MLVEKKGWSGIDLIRLIRYLQLQDVDPEYVRSQGKKKSLKDVLDSYPYNLKPNETLDY
jgi:hypothetical protein